MENCSSSDVSAVTPPWEVQGVTEVRQRTIAAMIARGFSVKQVAKKLKMSESRIYHLLSDRDSAVNAEINRILNELFAASDRRLINLYNKALQKLEDLLSSSDEEKQFRAIDRIIRIIFARSSRNGPSITLQHFGIQANEEQQNREKRLDEIVLQKRRERGLPDFPDENDL
jgi:AcrR family transcriptional regulator